MRVKTALVLGLSLSICLVACTSSQTPFEKLVQKAKTIRKGDSLSDVLATMGKPDYTATSRDGKSTAITYIRSGHRELLALTFINGKFSSGSFTDGSTLTRLPLSE